MKIAIISLMLSFIAAGLVQCRLFTASTSPPPGQSKQNVSQSELKEKIDSAMGLLDSDEADERAKAENDLLDIAQLSPPVRKTVIDRTIQVVRALELQKGCNQKQFFLWLSANHLFQKLHAYEAIDLLISLIFVNDGYSGNGRDHRPGQDSLIVIGADSVPQLSDALLSNTNPLIRVLVAESLGNIGGSKAKQGLERARQQETNREVIESIEIGLATIARTPSR